MEKKKDFNQSELFISLRSPFARRVRLALLENQIPYKETVCDVFKPTEALIAVNPLVRVPVLRLASGETLIDSNLILQALYETLATGSTGSSDSANSLMPSLPPTRFAIYRWQAIAAGFAEKTVEYFLETQRPPANQDPDTKEDLKNISERVLAEIETTLIANPSHSYLVGNSLTQVDLDLASALTYFGLRYSPEWKKRYPRTSLYLAQLEQRPSFVQTCPPA
ncbi:MAG: glutathione S-transferase family protein [Bdellovibrionia bacterium]